MQMRCDAMRCVAMRCDAMRCVAMRCDAMRCDQARSAHNSHYSRYARSIWILKLKIDFNANELRSYKDAQKMQSTSKEDEVVREALKRVDAHVLEATFETPWHKVDILEEIKVGTFGCVTKVGLQERRREGEIGSEREIDREREMER